MGNTDGLKVEIGNGLDLKYLFPGNSFLSSWNSPEAFARHVENLDPNKAWNKETWSDHNPRFYGATMEEALKLSKDGWKEGAYRVEKLRGRILAASPIIKRPAEYGIVGVVPSIPRAVAGNPMNMRKMESTTSRKRPVLTLVTNMANNCYVSHEMISNHAAVVCALVDHIEAAGFATEVITAAPSKRGNYRVLNLIKAKESTHPVDLKRMSFALGHVALFRRMVFADWFSEHNNQSGLGSSLGGAKTLNPEGFAEKNIFLIPPAEENTVAFATEDAAAKEGLTFLINSLKEQFCPAFPLTQKEREDILAEKAKPKKSLAHLDYDDY